MTKLINLNFFKANTLDKKKKGLKFFMKGSKKDIQSGDELSDHERKFISILILKKSNKTYKFEFISIHT